MNKLQKLLNDRMDELGLRPADVARQGGLTEATVSRYLAGNIPKRMQESTITKWAKALQLPSSAIREAAEGPRPTQPFELSPERQEQADLLEPEQAAFVKELIRLFDEANRRDKENPDETPRTNNVAQFQAINTDAAFQDIAARNWRDGDPDIDDDNLLGDA